MEVDADAEVDVDRETKTVGLGSKWALASLARSPSIRAYF